MAKKHKKRFSAPTPRIINSSVESSTPTYAPAETTQSASAPQIYTHFSELRKIGFIFVCLCALLIGITYSNNKKGSLNGLGRFVDRVLHIAE